MLSTQIIETKNLLLTQRASVKTEIVVSSIRDINLIDSIGETATKQEGLVFIESVIISVREMIILSKELRSPLHEHVLLNIEDIIVADGFPFTLSSQDRDLVLSNLKDTHLDRRLVLKVVQDGVFQNGPIVQVSHVLLDLLHEVVYILRVLSCEHVKVGVVVVDTGRPLTRIVNVSNLVESARFQVQSLAFRDDSSLLVEIHVVAGDQVNGVVQSAEREFLSLEEHVWNFLHE